jgi:hypothetical protein
MIDSLAKLTPAVRGAGILAGASCHHRRECRCHIEALLPAKGNTGKNAGAT